MQVAFKDLGISHAWVARGSKIKEVHMLGRRGPAQAAFTNPELKEMGELERADLIVLPEEAALDALSQEALDGNGDRATKRKVDMLNAFDGENFVDIILCDWNMPRVSGMDLLKQVRSCDPEIPFMMITGMADVDAVTEARSFGVTAYIKKPFSQEALAKKMSTLERVLNHRRAS